MNITDNPKTEQSEKRNIGGSDTPQLIRNIVIPMKAGLIKYHIYKAATQETMKTSSAIFMNSRVP